uniref:response regulator transcription factor n=1 Tax=Pedobacter schmidteae TaxID=2201271 RepID=UPI000EAB733A|nr:helix-turn-helix transcriptional regulator [Pedobacter schmidteae]
MKLPKNYSDFLQTIKHYDIGELGDIFKQQRDRPSKIGYYFNHFYSLMPASYILDYTTGNYIFGTDKISSFIDRPLSHFLDGGVELAVSLFHKKDLKVYSEKVIINNIQFLKDKPIADHTNYVLKCNYRIRTSRGDYRNVLQQSVFIKSLENGMPLAALGFLEDITHYRNDSKIVQTIEPLIHTTNSGIGTGKPLLVNTYFSDEQEAILTPREIEVMKYLCDDLTSVEIAKKLGISRHTVDTYRRNLILKTNSKTVIGVIRYAFTHGYV